MPTPEEEQMLQMQLAGGHAPPALMSQAPPPQLAAAPPAMMPAYTPPPMPVQAISTAPAPVHWMQNAADTAALVVPHPGRYEKTITPAGYAFREPETTEQFYSRQADKATAATEQADRAYAAAMASAKTQKEREEALKAYRSAHRNAAERNGMAGNLGSSSAPDQERLLAQAKEHDRVLRHLRDRWNPMDLGPLKEATPWREDLYPRSEPQLPARTAIPIPSWAR